MNRIKVVIFEPGKPGRIDYIPNKLQNMQRVVGGHIETVHLCRDAVIVCNEEGRLQGLPENRLGICGTFFVARDDGGEELVSLTREQADFLTGQFVACMAETEPHGEE